LKILIIRLSAIGDAIHCLPAAAELKRRIPNATIAWIVEPLAAPLISNNPVVDTVYVVPKREWVGKLKAPWLWPALFTEIGAFWSAVRGECFDMAVDFQGLLKSSVCALLSGAPIRVGFAGTREGAERLLTDRLDVGDYFGNERHVIDLNLALASFVCKRLAVPDGELEPAVARFPLPEPPAASLEKIEKALFPDGSSPEASPPVAVLIPGTTWTSKIWPTDNWCRLALRLSSELGLRICLVGGPSEATGNSQIVSWLHREAPETRVLDLTGQTSLLDLIALFRQSQLTVGGDTGPLHLAVAAGKPKVVGIYGSTPARRLGPYGRQSKTVCLDLWCQPCFEKVCPLSTTACLKDLSVDRVFAEIVEHLGT